MKAYYPKIAELEYKDKQVNIKIPVRMKKVVVIKYVCKHCNNSASLQRWLHYYQERQQRPLGGEFSRTAGKMMLDVPPALKAGDGILCPECLLKDKTSITMQVVQQTLFKVWASAVTKYVNVDKLLSQNFLMRWRSKERNAKSGTSTTMTVFFEDYSKAVEEVDLAAEFAKRHRKKVKLKVFKVTPEQLDDDFTKYEMRKIARRI